MGGSTPSPATTGSVAHQQSVRSDDPEGTRGSTSQTRPPALYVVGRADLPPGLRTAQIGHALIGWVLEHGAPPENLVVLQAKNEKHLWELLEQLNGSDRYAFHEPDLDDALTAIAVGPEHWRKLSSLPLLR